MLRTAEQKTKRKWLLFMIIAPGIFFILYWASLRGGAPAVDNVEMPESYVGLGERTELGGVGCRVFRGAKLFSDRVELPNNLAIAEPGRVFLGLGLELDSGVFQGEVEVVDSLGNLYPPLDVKKEVVAGTFGFNGETGELFMFKVSTKAESYYFVVKDGGKRAWKFANTYSE